MSNKKFKLTTKPHAFRGAVLTPKHASELTPSLVLEVTAVLAEGAIQNHSALSPTSLNENSNSSHGTFLQHRPNKSSKHNLSKRQTFRGMGDAAEDDFKNNSLVDGVANINVQYTEWITEAWHVLQWGEPIAALFWEMATMYHTLHVASLSRVTGGDEDSIQEGASAIPPILSCGSSSSTGTDNTKDHPKSPGGSNANNNASQVLITNTNAIQKNSSSKSNRKNGSGTAKVSITISTNFSFHRNNDNSISKLSLYHYYLIQTKKQELPVWLLGTFLLFHCEEEAFARNVSGEDERRFESFNRKGASGEVLQPLQQGNSVDFSSLLQNSTLSPRTRIHSGHISDNTHCAAFILRHLRKFLLFCCLPHNTEGFHAMQKLVRNGDVYSSINNMNHRQHSSNRSDFSLLSGNTSPQQIIHQHDREHSTIGHDAYLTFEDLERLSFIIHPWNGGLIGDAPLCIKDFFFPSSSNSNSMSIPLPVIESKLKTLLEEDLSSLNSNKPKSSVDPSKTDEVEISLSKMSINDDESSENVSEEGASSADEFPMYGSNKYKEITYENLTQKSIILNPDSNSESENKSNQNPGRLHDLTIRNCNDVHMYLLLPFENVTISGCTGCHFVIGAVAGLLDIVDCERTTITSSTRRVLVCNSFEVLNCVFTPSPPLLVGDNRSCQFAPYNTYYNGLRRHLLATGLAAQVVEHPKQVNDDQHSQQLPQLQCASNKWKMPIELAKLDIAQVTPHGSSSGGNVISGEGASGGADGSISPGGSKQQAGDESIPTPIVQPVSEFQVIFVPIEEESRYPSPHAVNANNSASQQGNNTEESLYCQNLANLLQLSPFRLPLEYEKRVIVKADRMRSIQQAIKTDLSPEQQEHVQQELNQWFRDWLVTSGNLRQVLDLVHVEKKAIMQQQQQKAIK